MANEISQWVVLGILIFLVLGALRQISLALPARFRAANGGPSVGRRLPASAVAELQRVTPDSKVRDVTLAFVVEGCSGCQRLLTTLEESRQDVDRAPVIIVAKTPSQGFREALTGIGIPAVFDDSAELWKACGITATPLVVNLDSEGRVVSKEVTHDVQRVALAAS